MKEISKGKSPSFCCPFSCSQWAVFRVAARRDQLCRQASALAAIHPADQPRVALDSLWLVALTRGYLLSPASGLKSLVFVAMPVEQNRNRHVAARRCMRQMRSNARRKPHSLSSYDAQMADSYLHSLVIRDVVLDSHTALKEQPEQPRNTRKVRIGVNGWDGAGQAEIGGEAWSAAPCSLKNKAFPDGNALLIIRSFLSGTVTRCRSSQDS